jgi:hypothetical protein
MIASNKITILNTCVTMNYFVCGSMVTGLPYRLKEGRVLRRENVTYRHVGYVGLKEGREYVGLKEGRALGAVGHAIV